MPHQSPPMQPDPPTFSDPFTNPIWNALCSSHRRLALTQGLARKYPADIAPFACVAQNTPSAFYDLRILMEPGETTYVLGNPPPSMEGLQYRGVTPCLQMGFPERAPLPALHATLPIYSLTCADAPAMVALTDVAFPGFFRWRTCLMGSYFGIWHPTEPGKLIAMAGERLVLDPHREISGVCTHPDYRGQGLAASLTTHLLHHHRKTHARSVLHVVSTNQSAIRIYQRLGFETLREVQLHRIKRAD
ncbi:MAG: GNAT family N-acetyltransferase [Acidobacteriaceae bacterium]